MGTTVSFNSPFIMLWASVVQESIDFVEQFYKVDRFFQSFTEYWKSANIY